ncbi:MAG: hypothetical protein KNN13_03700 [Hydrogenobacter thermophilus]|jgi:hypothetical protein|uniref:hypothetical protein n=1 Tax=Hydrogenobacter thermophilus TaxID=940 RepID=UPI001C776317|nr:hypothetical protein [Hydrogenobacter thermophilus]QWK20433.1 MAG: hypothetical protein KNN13_03700 [Hydrogenobacter thermophilus]
MSTEGKIATFLGLVMLVSGMWLLWFLNDRHMKLHSENVELRHHLAQLCQYIDNPPKKHRAVYDKCLEIQGGDRNGSASN